MKRGAQSPITIIGDRPAAAVTTTTESFAARKVPERLAAPACCTAVMVRQLRS